MRIKVDRRYSSDVVLFQAPTSDFSDIPSFADIRPANVLFAAFSFENDANEPVTVANVSIKAPEQDFKVIDVLPLPMNRWLIRAFGGQMNAAYPLTLCPQGYVDINIVAVVKEAVKGPVLQLFDLLGMNNNVLVTLEGRIGNQLQTLQGTRILS